MSRKNKNEYSWADKNQGIVVTLMTVIPIGLLLLAFKWIESL